MILFSTILKFNATLTKDAFIQLVLEWNRTSKYKENIVPDVSLYGSYSGKFGNETLSLEFVDYPEKQIMAVRHEKITDDGVIWDTDYVVNFEEKRIAIRLDRTYSAEALVMNGKFSTPHFITLLIEGGHLAEDRDLPVLRTPMTVTDEYRHVFSDIIKHENEYQLPVVYVKRTSDGHEPVDAKWLASRLKGAAHVLIEKDQESCKECNEICGAQKEEFGSITIYYPSENIAPSRFLCQNMNGDRERCLEKVIRNVIQYWNAQRVEFLYTWHGVNGAVLNDRLNQQMLRYRKAKEEIDQVYEAVDDDLKKMQEKLEELTRVNESLMLENSALRARVNAVNARPIIYQGEEEEFYPDEIKDVILSILDEVLANTEEKTRRADILEDLFENKSYQHLSENRKKKVKAIIKGYKNLSGSMRQELEELGITISGDGKHYKLTYKNDPRYMVTIGKTPSDGRAGNNTAALVNKTMM